MAKLCVGVLLALIAGLGGLFLDLQPVVYARLYTILTLALLAGILVRALAVTTRSEMSQVDDSDGSAEGGS